MIKKEQIVEVKKGQEGTGLLVESDGYINIDSKENKTIKESIEEFKSGDANELPRPFVVSAVFQKYGIENANGRVYPEAILKREVEKFQEKIRNRMALGECYTPDVLCLTEDGWKTLSDVNEGDRVLSLNPDNLKVEVATVISKVHHDYNGKMIRLKGRYINDLVTPGHKFPVFDRYHTFENFYTASEIHNDSIKDMSHKTLLKNKTYDAIGDEYFVTEGIKMPTFRSIYLNKKFIETSEEDYNGIVECINLDKNHIWYVMSNGKCHWTGNCEHPQDSNINLERIACNVVELHWEGRTLVGKLEIPISEGFRKYGICSTLADRVGQWIVSGLKIGVSSRALGSVKQEMGRLVVGDDLEILCWDVVSTPSTPQAYIETTDEKIRPYIQESDETKDNNKIITEDKYTKFEQWLND